MEFLTTYTKDYGGIHQLPRLLMPYKPFRGTKPSQVSETELSSVAKHSKGHYMWAFTRQEATADIKAPPGKGEQQLEAQDFQDFGISVKAPPTHMEQIFNQQAPDPPTVPRRDTGVSRRGHVFQPAQQRPLKCEKARKPNMTTQRNTWTTEYSDNFNIKNVRPTYSPRKTVQPISSYDKSTPNTLHIPKYNRTEYQANYGPKIYTADFNITLYRQLRGTV